MHYIVSLANPKQWLMTRISDFMMKIKWSINPIIFAKIEMGWLKAHSPMYFIKGKRLYAMYAYKHTPYITK